MYQRFEASRKYIFGASSVWGEENDNIIRGAYVVRGQEADPVFSVAPDYDSFSATKLDASKPEDRAFVEDAWSNDKDFVEIDGRQRAFQGFKEYK